MREISIVELQNIAGGVTGLGFFGNIGLQVGSFIGSLADSAINLLGGSSALISPISGYLGAGLGSFLDAPISLFSGLTAAQNTLNVAVQLTNTGITNILPAIDMGISSIFTPQTAS
ncbi:hypothetical protein [Commensalibacter oyaizuii]|uniref:Uncharacterized protein n=1 Tax=Commensalibacter oyaizuii TaxID=3043873 RepID=A0ABT6Q536_9PROT|nr:hypothetical protein [Commensalibacter sp. TBRC 16381]MDI2091661.1 hypothetical protein [Commensalibacter sp. TBRC 16381]